MMQDNVDLHHLVDHLVRGLQEEDDQESGDKSRKLPTTLPSADIQLEGTGQQSVAPANGSWPWQDWRIRTVLGGMNGRNFRATGPAGDVAV